MADLPVVTPRETLRALERGGFREVRQQGSHRILRKEGHRFLVVVPMHREDLAKGTLRTIIRDAGLSVQEFTRLL